MYTARITLVLESIRLTSMLRRATGVYTQSCLSLCDPVDCSPPGSSVHGILQQECWSGLPCPPPGDLPDPGTETNDENSGPKGLKRLRALDTW